MAETSIKNDVFKFVALRPPTKRKIQPLSPGRIVDTRQVNDTPVGRIIRKLGSNANMDRVLPQVKRLINEKNWSSEIIRDQDVATIAATYRAIDEQLQNFSTEGFVKSIEEALGSSPKDFIQSESANYIREGLWDRLHAFYLLNRETPVNLEEIIGGLRAFHIVESLANGEQFSSADDLREALNAVVLLPNSLVRIAPVTSTERPRVREQQERDKAKREHFVSLWVRYIELNKAVDDVQRLNPKIEVIKETPKPVLYKQEIDIPQTATNATTDRALLSVSMQRFPKFEKADINALSPAAHAAITLINKEPEFKDKFEALNKLHDELSSVTVQLLSIKDPTLTEMMPDEARQLPASLTIMARNEYLSSLGFSELPSPFPYPWKINSRIRPLGIGDLKVVKQILQQYVAGEVAHIENVLQGESKERKHRILDRNEEIVTAELETSEDTERDTQTTDRFELKKESEKTIQTDMSVSAGVTVSASYGPVQLGANANFAYSQSQTDTTRTSSNYARDVVDRSVTRIQKKTREERVTKALHEVEEINTHGLNNAEGTGNITGVYRWVDKYYEAQIYNYGKRMMFEFIVPEPAAFYIYSQNNNPAKAINLEKPKPLGNITHKDITESNYHIFIRDYNVQGVTPPPPEYHRLGIAFDQSGMQPDQDTTKSSHDLVVPDGYAAVDWFGQGNYRYWTGHEADMNLWIGIKGGHLGTYLDPAPLSGEDMVVPVAIVAGQISSYAYTVEIHCERTRRHYKQWQIDTFEKIMAAYKAAMAEYEDRLRAAEARVGIAITGQNPTINREIERTEMKKSCLTLLTGERYENFNSMSGEPPEIDLVDAAEEGRFIQFFEQAFEWEQITYLFYPYFWGRKDKWVTNSTTFDNDPLFTKFLQAGAARIVVPVQPAYNDAILYYLQTGDLWNGGDPPVIDDPLYIALYEELKDQQDDLGNATPEGDPWKVVLPTTLVWLQQGPELPVFI